MNNPGACLENVALHWQKLKGLKVVTKNYLSRAGKIDIIMLDDDTLCFIDVKYRRNQDFDSADYGIPVSGQQIITKTVLNFVNRNINTSITRVVLMRC